MRNVDYNSSYYPIYIIQSGCIGVLYRHCISLRFLSTSLGEKERNASVLNIFKGLIVLSNFFLSLRAFRLCARIEYGVFFFFIDFFFDFCLTYYRYKHCFPDVSTRPISTPYIYVKNERFKFSSCLRKRSYVTLSINVLYLYTRVGYSRSTQSKCSIISLQVRKLYFLSFLNVIFFFFLLFRVHFYSYLTTVGRYLYNIWA